MADTTRQTTCVSAPPKTCNIPRVSRDKSNHPAERLVGSASEEVEHDECGRIDWLAGDNSNSQLVGIVRRPKSDMLIVGLARHHR